MCSLKNVVSITCGLVYSVLSDLRFSVLLVSSTHIHTRIHTDTDYICIYLSSICMRTMQHPLSRTPLSNPLYLFLSKHRMK